MDREPTSRSVTLIVVGDERSPMRRFQISRDWLRKAAVGAVVAALVVAVGMVDYVRLRVRAVDVERLEAETLTQRDEVESVATSLEELGLELERLREFERKVRVIANLPESMAETTSADPRSPSAHQGGGLETAEGGATELPALSGPEAGTSPEEADAASKERLEQNHLRPEAISRASRKARRIESVAAARSASFEELLEELAGKSRRLASTPSIWPARGWLTSRYGYRVSPFTGKRQFHAAIDVAADLGTDVIASARGKVVAAGRHGALGKRIVIDHGYGMRTTYGHLKDVNVGIGDEVARGARIASVGTSGRSTGPHLHYAVEVSGRTKNPLDYVLD